MLKEKKILLFLVLIILAWWSMQAEVYAAESETETAAAAEEDAEASKPAAVPESADKGEVMDKPVELLAGFDEVIERAVSEWNVPGLAIAVVYKGEKVFSKGFGYRDVEEQLPVTSKTLFAIGSCTKAFTASALGMLVDQGLLEWDKPVRNYLCRFELKDPAASRIANTVDLLCHRTGLPRHDLLWYGNRELSREELIDKLKYLEPSASFREEFQYNNLMYGVCGYLTEKLSGKKWEAFVRENIFDPLGMERSNFSVVESQKTDDFAYPYREDENDEIQKIPFRNIDAMGPAGSINSCIEDISRWIEFNLDNGKWEGEQIIEEATMNKIHSPHQIASSDLSDPRSFLGTYGLGWGVSAYRGRLSVQHGGGIDGFVSNIVLFPHDDLGIVVLTNSETGLASTICNLAADRMLELEFVDWYEEASKNREEAEESMAKGEEEKEELRVKDAGYAHELKDYAGLYVHSAYGDVQVSIEEDEADSYLRIQYQGFNIPFKHHHYEVFTVDDDKMEKADEMIKGTKIMFRTNFDGEVHALEAPLDPRVDPVVFDKQASDELKDPQYLRQFTGKYEFIDQTAEIFLSDKNVLMIDIPGQKSYALKPTAKSKFTFEEEKAVSIRFLFNESAEVEEFLLEQAGRVFSFEKLNEEE